MCKINAKAHGQGITVLQLAELFPAEAAARVV